MLFINKAFLTAHLLITLLITIKNIFTINLENFMSISSGAENFTNFNMSVAENILMDTLADNPKNMKSFLPQLPKIVTKSGLTCDFPFVYLKRRYYDDCARNEKGRRICKIQFKLENAKETLSSNEELFDTYLNSDSEGILLKIDNDYYSECLSLQDTEQVLSNIAENFNEFNLKNKLLIELFSQIRDKIKEIKIARLNLLFELSESYCKSSNFTFDCLYENLILPISKTKELNLLSTEFSKIFENYKLKLENIVKRSMKIENYKRQYLILNDDNLNKLNFVNETSKINKVDEIKNSLNFILAGDKTSKISIIKFFDLLISVFNSCSEECKTAIESLFINNFNESTERIKIEIVSKLFNFNTVNETNLESLIYNKNQTKIIYNNNEYELNFQSLRFIKYKFWSLRYFLTILHRYILMDKLFYVEIVKGELSEESLNKILFSPNLKLSEKEKQSLILSIPILSPYISFGDNLKHKLKEIYSESSNLSKNIKKALDKTEYHIDSFLNTTLKVSQDLQSRIDFITEYTKKLKKVAQYKQEIKNFTEILKQTHQGDSLYKTLESRSEVGVIENIISNIYSTGFFSQECHNFIHYNSYFHNYALGKPTLSYISLSYDPYFYIDFKPDIKLFFLYGLININYEVTKTYNITITTEAVFDIYIENKMTLPVSTSNIFNLERYKNLTSSVFQIETTGLKNSFKEFKIKGRFDGDVYLNNTDKHFEISIVENKSETKEKANSKCKESLKEVSICFNPYIYKVDCDFACKFLSDNLQTRNKEKEKIEKNEKLLFKSYKKKINQSKNQTKENYLSQFRNTCINYCNAFTWKISVYKCLLRNIKEENFDSILIKCGAMRSWRIVYREANQNSRSKIKSFKSQFSVNDVLLGKKFYVEDDKLKIKLDYIPYIQASILNPMSKISFISNFQYEGISEYMFALGDMSRFSVVDKTQPFINGAPFTAFSGYNSQLTRKSIRTSFDISIFNTLKIDQKGIVIYNDVYDFKHNSTNYILYSENEESRSLKKYSEIFNKNLGYNVFVRDDNAMCLVSKPIFTLNLISLEYYIENVLLTKNIFSFVNNNYLIIKVPEYLNNKVLLLKTNTYQNKYSLNLNIKSRIYLAAEIGENFEKIAAKILEDGWVYMKGQANIIEIVTSDIGDDILVKDKYTFYECNFKSEANPVCDENVYNKLEKVTLGIFYKDFDAGLVNISYSFFDFDDLYGSLHLLLLQPSECKLDKNTIYTHKDKVNNYLKLYEDYLPSFGIHFEDFPEFDEKLKNTNFTSFNSNSNSTLNGTNLHTHLNNKTFIKMKSNANFTRPSVKFNQQGCVVSLDAFGNLYFKKLQDIISSKNKTWILIKNQIKLFDMNEDKIIVQDFGGKIQVRSYLKQNNECLIDQNGWKDFIFEYDDKIKIKEVSLSGFNCLWIIDSNNSLFYVPDFNQAPEDSSIATQYTISEVTINKKINSFYSNGDKLYIITLDGSIIIKRNIYNAYKDECTSGDEPLEIKISNESNIPYKKIKTNLHNPIVMLSEKGDLYFRRNTNILNEYGINWESIEINKGKLNKLVDFDLGPKDIITLSTKGKILLLYDLNRPRFKDV